MKKRILFLEPHIDDFELSSSIFLNQLEMSTVFYLVTFCSGIDDNDSILRKGIRRKNIEYIQNTYKHITIKDIQLDICLDTWLTDFPMSELIGRLQVHISNLNFDTIMIPWEDLHSDHRMVNSIGKVLGRDIPTVIEYQIQNSVYPNDGRKFNLEYVMEYDKFQELNKVFTCEGFNNKLDILRQKNHRVHQRRLMADGGDLVYVSDRFNILKATKFHKDLLEKL